MDEPRKNGSDTPLFNKPLIQIILAAFVGVSGATGVQLSMPGMRSDAFTGKQALELELRVIQAVEDKVNNRIAQFTKHEMALLKHDITSAIRNLEHNLPPQPLRERVIALEEFARRQDQNYQIPTRKWNH